MTDFTLEKHDDGLRKMDVVNVLNEQGLGFDATIYKNTMQRFCDFKRRKWIKRN